VGAVAQTGPFGLGLARLDEALRQKTNLAEGAGLVIRAVRKGSEAEAAGLRPGDVVTAVNGSAVRAELGIAEQVQAGRAKSSLVFEVLRDGKAVTLTWKK
jgi:S1-C subfamily serine protease